jgi:hypothetical protein
MSIHDKSIYRFVKFQVKVAEPDPSREIRPIRSDQNRPDLIFLKSQTNLTRPDPVQDQMTCNPIEIYQRSEKIKYVN